MAITVLPANLLVEGLNTLFLQKVMAGETQLLQTLANVVRSSKRTETMAFIGDVPQFREWNDRRQITKLSTATYSLTTQDWEASISFDMRDWDDEQVPMLALRVSQMAEQVRRHTIQLMIDTIVQANTLVGYDGVTFYNDSHPARGDQTATQDNNLTGSGTTVANLQTDYDAVMTAFQRFVDEANQPWHSGRPESMLITCPPELFRSWSTVLFSTTQPDNAGQNVYQGGGDLAVSSRFADTDDWFAHYVGGVVKPFVFLESQPINTSSAGLDRSEWRNTKEVTFGADARYQAGVALWQNSVRVTN